MSAIPSQKIVQVTITAQNAGMIYDEGTELDSPEWRLAFQEALVRQYRFTVGELKITVEGERAVLRWAPPAFDAVAESYHRKALELARQRSFAQAAQQWKLACETNPDDPHYWFNLSIAQFEQGDFKNAISSLERVLAICPVYHRAYFLLGRAFIKLRRFADARRCFAEGLKFEPDNLAGLINLAATQSILGEHDNAIATYERAVALKPNEPRAYFGLAKIYSALGDVGKANDCFRKVVELDKSGVLAPLARHSIVVGRPVPQQSGPITLGTDELFSSGYRALVEGDYDNARRLLESYLEKKRKDARAWSLLATAYMRLGDLAKADEACGQAIKLEPNEGSHHKKQGIVRDLLGDPAGAHESLSHAAKLGRSESTTLGLMGKCLVLLGRFREAAEVLEQALRHNRNNLLAHYFAAAAYRDMGSPAKAQEHLQHILSVRVASPLKERAERLLADLGRTPA
ncbi:MAG: tetratricopeptide repeat protein [bacterium]|jgi:Flp pilus assembly protein TadD|nr:tetratricopeptide repeat protein [candidate division KSB1 bacterium]MDH7558662.1 tetratricopeptide repeat protein [bacterium]